MRENKKTLYTHKKYREYKDSLVQNQQHVKITTKRN